MVTSQATINLSTQLAPPIVQAVQGDTGREISFSLADFVIPTGASATYYIQKPSGEAVYNAATISGNTILCELTAQSLAEVGENNMQVRIIKDDDIVTSFDVILLVRPFRGIDAIESDTEMNIFDKAVEQAAEDFQSQAEQIVEKVVESIPGDYTELTEEVSELNERLEDIYNSMLEVVGSDSSVAFTKTVPQGATTVRISEIEADAFILNQLFGSVEMSVNGLTYAADDSGWITVSGTSSANSGTMAYDFSVPAGHKYACIIDTDGITLQPSLSLGFQVFVGRYGGGLIKVYDESFIDTGAGDGTNPNDNSTLYFRCGSGISISGKIRIQVFDLTVMFGVGNEPMTIAGFRAIVTGDYYAFNSSGTEVTVSLDAILLNGTEQTEMSFAVEEGDVITIQTTDAYDIISPIPNTVTYLKDKINTDDIYERIQENTDAIVENTEDIAGNTEAISQQSNAINILTAKVEAIEESLYTVIGVDSAATFTKIVPPGAELATVSAEETEVMFNQVVPSVSKTANGLTYTTDENGWINISGTSTGNGSTPFCDEIPANHKAAVKIELDGITLQPALTDGLQVISYSNYTVIDKLYDTCILTYENAWTINMRCGTNASVSGKIRLQVFDLTEMFGAGNEPATVADFLDAVSGNYYSYTTGTAVGVTVDEILLNNIVQAETSFRVSDGDVITISTNSSVPGLDFPVASTVTYYAMHGGGSGDDEAYIEESAKVTTDLLNEDADIRIMLFTDNHSYDDFKYKKYANMMSHGIVDYLIGLGDYKDYVMTRDKIEYKNLLLSALTKAGREANCLYIIGNHDVGIKGVTGAPDSVDYLLTPKEDYDVLNRHYCKNNSIVFDEENPFGGYYYIDNDTARIRMIVLNSSDIFKDDGTFVRYVRELMFVSQRQLTWFYDMACKLTNKDDPSEWAIIVFMHTPWVYGASDTTFFKILKAVKDGSTYTDEFTVYNRMILSNGIWENAADQVNGDTLTIDADYTSQGAIDVIGIVCGHEHLDENKTFNGINKLTVRCDNGHLDDYYLAPVSGLSAGTYYFTDINGVMWSINFESSYPTVAYFGYNKYFADAHVSPMPVTRYNDDMCRLGSNSGCVIVQSAPSGATEITGFFSERGDTRIGKESSEILCVNREERTLTFIPYGTASRRVVTF